MRKSNIFIICLIILSFIISVYLYPMLPSAMASHWNAYGHVNGYTSKFWGLFLMPIIAIGLFVLLIVFVKIDPLKKNIAEFRHYFDSFIVVLFIFLFYIHALTLFWNLDYRFDMIMLLLPAFAVLTYFVGVLIENSKMNWSIGIRTPWTLSSEIVWDKTHNLGGKLFKIIAFVILFSVFVRDYAFWIMMSLIVACVVFLFAYSYYEFQKLPVKKIKKK